MPGTPARAELKPIEAAPSIECLALSKSYVLRAGPLYRLGHALRLARTPPLQRLGERLTGRFAGRTVTALRPLDFAIEAGETVAILGRNGSGKSTLLSLITGVLNPTAGECRIAGRVSAILELGSGFHPDFTGRANLRLKAALQGLSRAELDAKMDDVLAFADIGPFIDEPVSTYSTGMRMRLAFGLITAVAPDILIVDEALSVGDTFFQSKCIRWIEQFIAEGRIFLCVSHDIFTVRKLCARGLVLDQGRLLCDGPISEAANLYYKVNRGGQTAAPKETPLAPGTGTDAADPAGWQPVTIRSEHRTGGRQIELLGVDTRPELERSFEVGEWLTVRLRMRAREDIANYHFGFGLRDKRGLLLGGMHTFYEGRDGGSLRAGEVVTATFELSLAVPPADYLLLLGIGETFTDADWVDYDVIWDAARIAVHGPSRFWGLTALPHRHLQVEKTEPVNA
ncbi:MAG: ABC transporter ATP-binding protein [Opitutales bacterium]